MTTTPMEIVTLVMTDYSRDAIETRENIAELADSCKTLTSLGGVASAMLSTALTVNFVINPGFFVGFFLLSSLSTTIAMRECYVIWDNLGNHTNSWFWERLPSSFTAEDFVGKVLENTWMRSIFTPLAIAFLNMEFRSDN